MKCDFCQSPNLTAAYEVPESPRGAVIRVCAECSLAQTEYRLPKPSRTVSLSSGPDWGNVRHGKSVRLAANLEFIGRAVDISKIRSVLDIGSSRGHFVKRVLSEWKNVSPVAIEPDWRVIDYAREISTFVRRLEDVGDIGKFDFIYCSHTLEHADSASAMLRKIRSMLAPEGHVFIEVPSIAAITSADVTEEFFIDKHAFHFSRFALSSMTACHGFCVKSADVTPANLTVLLGCADIPEVPIEPSQTSREEANDVESHIDWYRDALAENRAKLRVVGEKVAFLASRQRVAFWGAGRQLDAFLKYSGFAMDGKTCALVDEHLAGIVGDVAGLAVQNPAVLRAESPDTVVIFARDAAEQIAARVRSFGIRNAVKFTDLMN